MLGHIKYLRGT